MKSFLSSLECTRPSAAARAAGYHTRSDLLSGAGIHQKYNLHSYYFLRKYSLQECHTMIERADLVLLDSGVFSLSFKPGAQLDDYVDAFCSWLHQIAPARQQPPSNILGVFEMDIDQIGVPMSQVLAYRAQMERATSLPVIPVWHRTRKVADWEKCCHDYPIVAITGRRNEDIRDDQIKLFVRYAHRHGAKVHALAGLRSIMADSGVDYADSATWSRLHAMRRSVLSSKKIKALPKQWRIYPDEWGYATTHTPYCYKVAQDYYARRYGD